MNGDAAHRHRFAAMLAARGQRDVEQRGRCLGIVKKQFEEIAHAVEEQTIAGLSLSDQYCAIIGVAAGGALLLLLAGSGTDIRPCLVIGARMARRAGQKHGVPFRCRR